MTPEELDTATAHLPTKSAKIRALHLLGLKRTEIANLLGIRYAQVRTALVTPYPASNGQPFESTASLTAQLGEDATGVSGLSIQAAKLGLAMHFGVHPNAVEIIIRG